MTSANRAWSVQGSAPEPYTIMVNSTTDLLSCSCPAWRNKRMGKPRHCKHAQKIADQEGLALVERDEQMFVVGSATGVSARVGPAPAPLPDKKSDNGGFISPMLASKMPDGWDADRYDAAAYVMEEKFDGHRLIVRKNGGDAVAWSRLGNKRTLPNHIADAMRLLPVGVYDGELIVPGMKSYDVTAGVNTGREALVLFDLLEALGQDTTRRTQDERRALLEVAVEAAVERGGVRLTEQFAPSVKTVKAIWARGGEGAIIKRRNAPYRPGVRSPDWVKAKGLRHVVVTITGWEKGKSGPYSTTVGVDAKGTPVPVKTLDNATLRMIERDPLSFVGRRLVVQYQEQTPDGRYRHPMWDHFAAEHER